MFHVGDYVCLKSELKNEELEVYQIIDKTSTIADLVKLSNNQSLTRESLANLIFLGKAIEHLYNYYNDLVNYGEVMAERFHKYLDMLETNPNKFLRNIETGNIPKYIKRPSKEVK